MINIAFRADGSEQIGMGHIMRCLALAEQLQKYSAKIYFYTRNNKQVIEKVQEKGFQAVIIGNNLLSQEVKEVNVNIKKNKINALITDSYDINEAYLDEIKKNVLVLVTVDDLNQMAFPSDLVINGNIYAGDLEYRSKYGNTRFLLGPRYVLMRKEFLDVPKRKIRRKVENILVTVGGSDVLNLTPQILKTLDIIDKKLGITVVIGPNFSNVPEIRATAFQMEQEVILVEDANNIKDLMLACDMAVTAGGTTLYELAVTGTPAVVVLQAENQILAAEKMNNKGIIIDLGLGNGDLSGTLKRNIEYLIENYNLRESMSYRGQQLLDGHGCSRCAQEIIKSLKEA